MTEEQKEKYANFLDKISEILGLNKPVDILRLCAVTDEYLRPFEKRIAELETQIEKIKSDIEKLKVGALRDGECAIFTVLDVLYNHNFEITKEIKENENI